MSRRRRLFDFLIRAPPKYGRISDVGPLFGIGRVSEPEVWQTARLRPSRNLEQTTMKPNTDWHEFNQFISLIAAQETEEHAENPVANVSLIII